MAEAANPQSETVSIDQITSIYKARPGFRVVPLEITDELTIRYSPEEAIGTAWYWIDGTKKRCLLVEVARSLHLDVRLLTCYREQAKVSSVRTREYIHAGIFPYLKRISDRFISTYRYAFSVHQNISNVH